MRVVNAFELSLALGLLSGVLGCAASPSSAGTGGSSAGFGGLGSTGGSGGTAAISGSGGGGGVGGTGGFAAVSGGGGTGGFCTGLQCQQHSCTTGSTTISGTVYDPAGKNPLYNVAVYVPNEAVQALPSGASCDSCEALYTGHPIAVGLTDAAGHFTIQNAPDGDNIPLVVQVGKWRRQFVIPTVTLCQDNPQADRSLTLPKNRSEGDIPNIAIASGGADTLECLLRRIGVDASEYVPGASVDGRVHIFQGGDNDASNTDPPAPLASAGLWNTVDELLKYDIVLLSCEGEETNNMNQQALHDYASMGGRVFASHYHYAWFNSGPYGSENLATWSAGGNSIDNVNGEIITTLSNGMPFPKGIALHEWLGNVGALTNNVLPIEDAKHNADVGPTHTVSQAWIIADANSEDPGATQYFSFNTPTDAAITPDGIGYCGRVVFSDLHVGAASGDDEVASIPSNCADADLSAQEKALEFMLFDLSSCVTPNDAPPEPPPLE